MAGSTDRATDTTSVKQPGAEPMLDDGPAREVADPETIGYLTDADYERLEDAAHSRAVGAMIDGIRGRGS